MAARSQKRPIATEGERVYLLDDAERVSLTHLDRSLIKRAEFFGVDQVPRLNRPVNIASGQASTIGTERQAYHWVRLGKEYFAGGHIRKRHASVAAGR